MQSSRYVRPPPFDSHREENVMRVSMSDRPVSERPRSTDRRPRESQEHQRRRDEDYRKNHESADYRREDSRRDEDRHYSHHRREERTEERYVPRINVSPPRRREGGGRYYSDEFRNRESVSSPASVVKPINSKGDEWIHIREFDLSKITMDAVIVLIGRRRSGKSWATRHIMYSLSQRGMPYGKVYSGTEHCSPFFQDFFPKLFIEQEFTNEDLGKLLDLQSEKTNRVRKKYHTPNGKRLSNNMLLVFDDMMSQDDIWKKSPNFRRIFVEGRHYNLLFILSLQFVMGIPPALRENVDYAFLFASEGANLKKLWENYAGVIPTFDMFKKIFRQCTVDKGCMVIDRTSTSERLEDKVFWFRAKDVGKFRFGSKEFWAVHDQNYQSDSEDTPAKKLKRVIETYGDGKKYKISIG